MRLEALHVLHLCLRAVARACGDVEASRSRCRTLASGVQASAPLGDHTTCTRLLLRCCSSETHFHVIVTKNVTIIASLDVSGLMTGSTSSAAGTTSGCISAISPSLSPSTFPVTPFQGLVLPFLDLSRSYPSIFVSFELSITDKLRPLGACAFPLSRDLLEWVQLVSEHR